MGRATAEEIKKTRQMEVPSNEQDRLKAVSTRIWGNGDLSQDKVDTLRDISRFFN